MAKITFVVIVITSSVAEINFVAGEITFIVAVITSSVDTISFFVAKINFVVAGIKTKMILYLLFQIMGHILECRLQITMCT